MLFNGTGGPPNQAFAMVLFKRAASTGHAGALFALNVLSGVAG